LDAYCISYPHQVIIGNMEILDGKNHSKWAQPHHLNREVSLLNGGPAWGWLDFPGVADEFTPEALKRADARFLESFRALANQWIDSGIDNEVESPLTRDVRKVPPGYREPLFDILSRWLNRNMPLPALMNTGRIAIWAQAPNYQTTDEKGLVQNRDPEEYAEECAIYHFKELLETPGAHRLARCANPKCQRLYLRRRLRKKEIKRGTFCVECAGKGSQVRTRATRENRRRMLIALAADYWGEWEAGRKRGERSSWIALKVNRRSGMKGTRPPITGKWVSQNRTEIEREIVVRGKPRR
jgi:hypothetical protein